MSSHMNPYRQVLYQYVTPAMGGLMVLMNSVELFFVLKSPKKTRQTMGIVYIINLCISDILVGIVMIILKSMTPFMNTTLKDDPVAGEIYSIIRYCLIRLSLFVSVFNLVALTIDRLWAVTSPFSHRKKPYQFAIKICSIVWLVSLAFSTGVYSMSRFQFKDTTRYNTLVFPVATFTAFLVFSVCYSKIFMIVRQSSKKRQKYQNTTKKRNPSITDENNNVNKKDQTKAEMRFLFLAVKTVSVFVICWMPFSIQSLLRAAGGAWGGESVYSTFFCLALLNSIINPFIYIQHTRKALLTRWKRFGKRKSQSQATLKLSMKSTSIDNEGEN